MKPKKDLNKDDFPFYVASDILKQLNKGYKKVTEGDQDRIYVVTGREGLGKSTLAMQLAYSVDQDLTLSNIVFTADQLERRIKESKQFTSIIFDEAFSGLSSKGAISKENRRLVRLLMMCRQRNLFIFIVLPSFFLLEKYVGIFRSTALFNVLVSRKNFKLRYYKVYNYQKKKELYIKGKNLMDYSRPKIPKSHRFYRKLPPTIDETAYRAKKLDTFNETGEEVSEESKHLRQRGVLSAYLKVKYDFSYVEQVKLLDFCGCGVVESNLSRNAKDVAEKLRNADCIIYNNNSEDSKKKKGPITR